ncbi:MAG TPA: hypothetical protein VEF37_01030 [Thermodesulfovibrionales bacterium]|nr:hypothetical protein [Thermodesulfovibrionales bacterium]
MGPPIRYLISSPYGDIPADKSRWDLPLEGDELKTTYRLYFHSIKDFLSKDEFKPFLSAISKGLGREVQFNDISEIIIRTEKHGVLYHPASVELILNDSRLKFGLNVAVSDIGRYWLKEEFGVLHKLHSKFALPYLPMVYGYSELNATSFLLEEWFEGYHEFHISRDEDGTQKLKLWDFDEGYKYLTSEQSFEIYKKASQILTLYYDLEDFSQILAWHHAAGDFVVKIENRVVSHPHPTPTPSRGRELTCSTDKCSPSTGGRGLGGGGIDIRLTTARRYEPFMGFADSNALNPILALCYYFLNLTIRMRLDKLDGLEDVVWADDTCIQATLIGFFEAIQTKGNLKPCLNLARAEDFLSLLQSFTQKELKTIIISLIDQYKNTSDYPVIMSNMDKHIDKLFITLQNLPL